MHQDYKGFIQQLNEYQKAAVYDDHRACLVNANVGSGKTTVLIAKIMYLHMEKGLPYDRMVVLTFTNKAAGEIKERLLKLEPELSEKDLPWFGTFHSVAMNLLREKLPIASLGYGKDFEILDPNGELEICDQLIQEKSLKIKYKNRLKKRMEGFRAGRLRADKKDADDFFTLMDLLKEKELELNQMTFSDLIDYANQLLPESDFYADYVIIDEVQDCDQRQLALIDRLMKKHRLGQEIRLFAVGDPNQVIYSWRGSVLNVFFSLKDKYAAKEYSLPVNYRSSGIILEAAKCFKQQGESLLGVNATGARLNIKKQYDSFSDAEYIASEIRNLYSKNVSYKDIAIFYRLQSQSEIFEKVLKREGIPYKLVIKRAISDIPVIYFLYKILNFSLCLDHQASAVYVLTDKTYGPALGAAKASKLISKVLESLETSGEFESPAGKGKKRKKSDCPDLLIKMIGFQKAFYQKPIEEVTEDMVYEYFSLDDYLHPNAASYEEDKGMVMDFLRFLLKKRESDLLAGEGNLFSILISRMSELILKGTSVFMDEEDVVEAVSLMTLHASKGLEFSHVFITGMNQGVCPLGRTSSYDEEEEERRLFYVGITRAKHSLTFSYYINPDYFQALPEPSKFLRMLPTELLEDDANLHARLSLKELKKLVVEEKKAFEEAEKKEDLKKDETKNVFHHDHYGEGTVVSEDEMMITVQFPEYGEKTFMKAFLS